jgi:DNA-binding CsgD family transcriptional regulator
MLPHAPKDSPRLIGGGLDYMILERDVELSRLAELVDDVGTSGGRVVLVRGEAGIGKSTLINRVLTDMSGRAHTLMGACDDLLTPQPLGPIWDIARDETSLAEPLTDGDRRAVMESVLDLLSRSLRPTVMVLEDTQWADEATLDLIKFLGRRIARTNALLVLTFRDAEVDADHPLRLVIGELPTQNIVRMPLTRLTAGAVRLMVQQESFDVEEVLALTGGNPLFVTEVVASGTDGVPISVRESVLARAAKLSPEARRILDLVSVAPGEIERDLVDKINYPTAEQLAEAVRQGLMRVDSDALSFPHDLQRRAIERSLGTTQRHDLNRQVLKALGESADPARLVHHARGANDVDAIVAFAPRAARTAMAIQSTAEAVAHFRILEPFLDRVKIDERAAILTDWAMQEYYLDNVASVSLIQRAVEAHRASGDRNALARALVQSARINTGHARPADALAASNESVAILEDFDPSSDLAKALAMRAFLEFMYADMDELVMPLIDRTMTVAEEVGDEEALIMALNVRAHAVFSRGDEGGMAAMEESLSRALRLGDHWHELRALSNMAGMYGDVRDVSRAADYAQRARDTAIRYEIRSIAAAAEIMHAEFLLWKGDWAAAANAASDMPMPSAHTETMATRILGTIQMRQGRTEARTTIMGMWSSVQPGEGPTVVDPTATAVAEYLWLSGTDDPELVNQLENVLARGIDIGNPWPSGAFAFWMWKLGLLDECPEGTADFYGWIIKGEYEKSVAFWHERGIPYEEGLALMHGTEAEQIEAIRIFEDLGAVATANKVRRSLSEQGVKVPRGKSQATRSHTAGLTARQAEVLDLLALGLTNTEIADELFVSYRTVENHVSAVLMKLDVPSREAAVAAARTQGILETT